MSNDLQMFYFRVIFIAWVGIGGSNRGCPFEILRQLEPEMTDSLAHVDGLVTVVA